MRFFEINFYRTERECFKKKKNAGMVTLNYEKLAAAIEESGLKKGILAHKMQIAPRTLTDSINERRLSVEYLVQVCA